MYIHTSTTIAYMIKYIHAYHEKSISEAGTPRSSTSSQTWSHPCLLHQRTCILFPYIQRWEFKKENKKVRKKRRKTRSRPRKRPRKEKRLLSRKKERKHALDQESKIQEKKTLTRIGTWN